MQFDSVARRFVGTPGIDDLGEYTFTIEATNKYKSTYQNFTIDISNN